MLIFEIWWYIVSYDIWFFLSHIGLHHIYLYTKIHKHHHSVDYTTMTYLDTYKGHYMESVIQGVGVFIPLLWLDYNSFIIALCLINVRGMMRHDVQCIPWIGDHHIIHHQYPQYNFGEYWLDYLGGTLWSH